jgi:hypothetical protein
MASHTPNFWSGWHEIRPSHDLILGVFWIVSSFVRKLLIFRFSLLRIFICFIDLFSEERAALPRIQPAKIHPIIWSIYSIINTTRNQCLRTGDFPERARSTGGSHDDSRVCWCSVKTKTNIVFWWISACIIYLVFIPPAAAALIVRTVRDWQTLLWWLWGVYPRGEMLAHSPSHSRRGVIDGCRYL